MKKIVTIAAILTGILCSQAVFSQTDVGEAIVVGVSELSAKHYQDAIYDFTDAINHSIKNKKQLVIAYCKRSIAETALGQYDEAIKDCNEAIVLDNKCYEAYLERSSAELANGNYQLAVNDVTVAIAHFTADTSVLCEAYLLKARAELSSGNTAEGMIAISNAISYRPAWVEPYWLMGKAFLQNNDRQKALNYYDTAITRFTNDTGIGKQTISQVYVERGNIELTMGDYVKALKDDSVSIALNPKAGEAYWDRGFDYYEQNMNQKAISDYMIALTYYSDDKATLGRIYVSIGISQNALGNYKEAVDACNKALAMDTDARAAYWWRGNAYKSDTSYELAISDYNKALTYYQNDPQSASKLYYLKAMCDKDLKWASKQLHDDSIAIVLDSTNANALADRGDRYRDSGQYKLAIIDYTKTIDSTKSDSAWLCNLYTSRGICEMDVDYFQQAIDDYTKAIAYDSHNAAVAYFNRGYSYEQVNKYDLAISDATKAMSYYQGDSLSLSELYNNRGRADEGAGKENNAHADYKRAMAYDPHMRVSIWSRAGTEMDKGENDVAILDYTNAIALFKGDSGVLVNLYQNRGFCEGRERKYQKAVNDVSIALTYDATDAFTFYERGRNYLLLNKKDSALRDFKRAMKMRRNEGCYPYCLLFTGDTTDALNIVLKNIKDTTINRKELAEKYYDLACFMSLINKSKESMSYLKKAIDHGYSRKFALYDPDFDTVRKEPEYISLTTNK